MDEIHEVNVNERCAKCSIFLINWEIEKCGGLCFGCVCGVAIALSEINHP